MLKRKVRLIFSLFFPFIKLIQFAKPADGRSIKQNLLLRSTYKNVSFENIF